jgi:hypothetical protein
MSVLQFLTALVRRLGPKLPQAWPFVVHAYEDLMKAYEIVNGKPLVFEGAVTVKTPEGVELAKMMRNSGMDDGEAIVDLVSKAEFLDDRFHE